MSIFKNWTQQHTDAFQNEIMQVNHNLEATGLFADAALIDLLDKHPSEKLDVCTMGEHELYPNQFRTGDFRDCSGAVLLEAVKAGCLWINVREAMNVHPEYNAVMKRMYGGLAEKTGNHEFNARGGILISSPVARVPYHADRTHTVLWHVRGTKRVYIYPMTQEFMSDRSYEKIVTNTIVDDLPYATDFDEKATVLKLTGGEMASWKLNQPHKVVNETFCVSVTTEYSNRASALKNAGMFAQAAMRSKFGSTPVWDDSAQPVKLAKSIFGKALQKTGLYKTITNSDFVTFKVDKSSPNYIVDIDPVARNF